MLLIKVLFASLNHRIKLRDHDGTLSKDTEFPSDELIGKMAECVVVLKLVIWLLDREL